MRVTVVKESDRRVEPTVPEGNLGAGLCPLFV